MRQLWKLTAIAALALSACNGSDKSEGNASAASENAAAPATSNSSAGGKDTGDAMTNTAGEGGKLSGAASGGGSTTLNNEYLVGVWTDTGDCANTVNFLGDGRFISSEGAKGLWVLEGDQLTIQGERAMTLKLVPIDRDTMNVKNPDGSIGRSTRC